MFFTLSKILWSICAPLTFISLMIIGGFLVRRYQAGKCILGCGVVLLIICGFLPIGHNLLVYQENQYPVMTDLPPKVDGIIVLGGSIDLEKSLDRDQGQLNDRAARITEMIFLMKHYPKAKIIFTGGNGSMKESSSSEAIEVDKLLKHMGFDTSRIIYEEKSRNTFENMQFSKTIAVPKGDDTWLLVTSAFHMKRSAAIFNSNGWDVIPYPAGYMTRGDYRVIPNFEVLENMYKLQIAVKEMIGIMAYTLTGKINFNDVTDTPSPVLASGPDTPHH